MTKHLIVINVVTKILNQKSFKKIGTNFGFYFFITHRLTRFASFEWGFQLPLAVVFICVKIKFKIRRNIMFKFSVQPTTIEDYNVVVYMLSYDGPLSHLSEIATDIVNQLGITSGKVLFDTLTSKGNIKNRFYSAKFDNGQFVDASFEIVHYSKNSDVRKASSQFYKDQDLRYSLVTNVQKRILKNGYVL